MKRRQLFELTDQPWLPSPWRSAITGYLDLTAKLAGHGRTVAALLDRPLSRSRVRAIVELGAGGGGPVVDAFLRLRAEHGGLRLTLTDLHPDESALDAAAQRQTRSASRRPNWPAM